MHKLLFSVLMIVVWWFLHTLQLDEEVALGTLHEGKRAVDRAAHAAAQRLDRAKLEEGDIAIEPSAARSSVLAYLQSNLRLGPDLEPLPGSFLRKRPTIAVLAIINDQETFPYTYRNPQYNYEVTLRRPGVVVIVHVEYPRAFGVLPPVAWDIKGAAEVVHA